MKRYYSSIVGIFVTLVLIASLAVPTSLANPTPASAASPSSMMQWWPVDTPDSLQQVTANLYSPVNAATGVETGSELVKLLIGVNGKRRPKPPLVGFLRRMDYGRQPAWAEVPKYVT